MGGRAAHKNGKKWAAACLLFCVLGTMGAGIRAEAVRVYTTEIPKECDAQIPAQYTDDLSPLQDTGVGDHNYVYSEGNVYYRQYHGDSYEEGALWAAYQPAAGTGKEIVRIGADGKRTELFLDEGYGDIYLIGGRFYMTEMKACKKKEYETVSSYVYSVDMRGKNRVDYGEGEFCAADGEEGKIVLKMWDADDWEASYFVLDCGTGELKPCQPDFCDTLRFCAYRDGWIYFDGHREGEETVCRLVAVSLDGKAKEIIALKSDTQENYGYREDIYQVEAVGDRICFVFGGYAGTGHFYQGGRIVTVKADGSDYRAIETFADSYYVCRDAKGTRIYFSEEWLGIDQEEYPSCVWDVRANTLSPSDFPKQILYGQRTHTELPYKDYVDKEILHLLQGETTEICAVPDHSGRIIRVAGKIEDTMGRREAAGADDMRYRHLFYADGYLYFTVEWSAYDSAYSVGWRDGYRRIRTETYRLGLGEKKAELLYAY